MKTSPYTNIAFISYKREDEEWAKWLQKKLEHYKLPTEIRKQYPDMEFAQNPRHVFKDTTDLSGGVLAKAIKEGLDSSKFLIVICSPRAAKSEWVCKEVQDFIDSGREEYIIPFIIDGEPYAKNPENECFPEALKTLAGERELLGINVNENGRESAAVKVVACMFELRFDTLWDRFQREKRRNRNFIIGGFIFAILLLLCIIAGGAYAYLEIQKERDRAKSEALRANSERDRATRFNIKLLEANDSIKKQQNVLLNTNELLRQERDNVVVAIRKMKVNQARAVAEKIHQLFKIGDRITAQNLAIELLSSDDFPYTPELEATFWESVLTTSEDEYTTHSILRGNESVLEDNYNEYQGNDDFHISICDKDNEVAFLSRGVCYIHNIMTDDEIQMMGTYPDVVDFHYSTSGDSIIIERVDETCIIEKKNGNIHKIKKVEDDWGIHKSACDVIQHILPSYNRIITISNIDNSWDYLCNIFTTEEIEYKLIKSIILKDNTIAIHPLKPEFIVETRDDGVLIFDAISCGYIQSLGQHYGNFSYACNGEYLIAGRNIYKKNTLSCSLFPIAEQPYTVDKTSYSFDADYDELAKEIIKFTHIIAKEESILDELSCNISNIGNIGLTFTVDENITHLIAFDLASFRIIREKDFWGACSTLRLCKVDKGSIIFNADSKLYRWQLSDNNINFISTFSTWNTLGNGGSNVLDLTLLSNDRLLVIVDQGLHEVINMKTDQIEYLFDPYSFNDKEDCHANQFTVDSFIKDGKLYTISSVGILRLFDIKTGKLICTFELAPTNSVVKENNQFDFTSISVEGNKLTACITAYSDFSEDSIRSQIFKSTYIIPTYKDIIHKRKKSFRSLSKSEKRRYYLE